MRSFLLDLLIAVAAYAAACALPLGRPASPLDPVFLHALTLVLGAQASALVLLSAYRVRNGTASRVRRFLIALLLGAGIGGTATLLVLGRERTPLGLIAAYTVLFGLAGTLWRSLDTVWTLFREANTQAPPPGMEAIGRPRSVTLGFRELLAYRGLVRSLVARDLKLKYRGSALGFLWSLLNPLVMTVVYTVAFTYLLKVREPGFVLHLLLGLLAWTFFANSAMMATGAITDSGGLIKSVAFPRAILPLATVCFNLVQYGLTLAVFLPVIFLWYRATPSTSMLLFPIFLLLHTMFTVGVAFALSALTALYRDVRHLTEIGISVLFWMTPIVYPLSQVGDKFRLPLLLTPMTPFVLASERVFYDRVWPEPAIWIVATVYSVAMLAIGASLFFSLEDRFGEQV